MSMLAEAPQQDASYEFALQPLPMQPCCTMSTAAARLLQLLAGSMRHCSHHMRNSSAACLFASMSSSCTCCSSCEPYRILQATQQPAVTRQLKW
jgi:hypothetical protein